MLDNFSKFVLPDSVLTAIRDSVVDKLAEGLQGKNRERVLKFHSEGKFRTELNRALERAVYRFIEKHEDQPFIDAIARNTDFWSIKSVQEAVKEIVVRPSSYLDSEFIALRKTFAEVVPTVESERVDDAVNTFLQCVGDEVMNIPQLAPIYQVQFQKISVQQGRDMIAAVKDASDIQKQGLTALLDAFASREKLALSGPNNLILQNESDLQELLNRYFEALLQNYKFMDLGGISPRVTSKTESRIVSIQMEDVFIPLRVKEDVSGNMWQESNDITEGLKSDKNTILEEYEYALDEISGNLHGTGKEKRPIQMTKMLKNQKIVILGHPGAGKTTIGKYISYMIAKKDMRLVGTHLQDFIPMIVKAAEYGKALSKNNNLSFYSYITGKLYTDIYGGLFAWALKCKKCLVIIDGLDEVPDQIMRMRVASKIEQFVCDYSENRFIVTSRIIGYRSNQLTLDFAHCVLVDLEKDQIIEFLKNWYMAVSDHKSPFIEKNCERKAMELWEAIDGTEGVKKLAGTPLLLTIIALVNHYGSKLPDRRVELYQLATETLLSNWPLKQREQKIDWKEIVSILEPIAYSIFMTSADKLITEYEFRPLFEQQVRKYWGTDARKTRTLSNRLLDKIEQHTGFFLRRGTNEHGQDVYGFLHPTFAEYLTAGYLAEQWLDSRWQAEPGEKKKLSFENYVHQDTWHEIILLMAGHLGTMSDRLATQFIEVIENLESPYERYLHRDLLLVAEIIGDKVPVSREKRDEIVFKLISLALDTPHFLLFWAIIARLKDIATAYPFSVRPKLLKRKESDNIKLQVRKALLSKAIGVLKDSDIDGVAQGLFMDREIRELSINFFRERTNLEKRAYVMIVDEEGSNSLYGVSKQNAERIINLQLPVLDITKLFGGFPNHEGDLPRIWLINLLQLSQLDASEAAVIMNLDVSGRIFPSALTWVRSNGSIRKRWIEEWIGQLTSNEVQNDHRMILNAMKNLLAEREASEFSLEIPTWKSSLKKLFATCGEPEIRSQILSILFSFCKKSEDWKEILTWGLKDSAKDVRLTAIRLLRNTQKDPGQEIVDLLRGLLIDASPIIRCGSASVLIKMNKFNENEITALLENVFSDSVEIMKIADSHELILILLKLADKAANSEIMNAIAKKFAEIIKSDLLEEEQFRRFFYEEVPSPALYLVDVLIELFHDNDPKIRRRALMIYSLINRGSNISLASHLHVRDEIMLLLEDTDIKVRLEAFKALPTKDISDLPALLNVIYDSLKSDDFSARIAVESLLRNNDFESTGLINRLIKMLTEKDKYMAMRAASMISVLKDAKARKEILAAIDKLLEGDVVDEAHYEVLWRLVVSRGARRLYVGSDL